MKSIKRLFESVVVEALTLMYAVPALADSSGTFGTDMNQLNNNIMQTGTTLGAFVKIIIFALYLTSLFGPPAFGALQGKKKAEQKGDNPGHSMLINGFIGFVGGIVLVIFMNWGLTYFLGPQASIQSLTGTFVTTK